MGGRRKFRYAQVFTTPADARGPGNLKSPLHGHASALVGKYAYVFSGNDGHLVAYVSRMYRLDTVRRTWTNVGMDAKYGLTLPAARFFAKMLLVEDKLYIYGGRLRADMYAYDLLLGTYTEIPQLAKVDQLYNSRRQRFGMTLEYCTKRHALFLFGGDLNDNGVQRFSIAESRWRLLTTKGSRPSARCFHCSGLRDSRMYIFGGKGKNGVYENSLHVLDLRLSTPTWSVLAKMDPSLEGRAHASLSLLGDLVVIYGGASSVNVGATKIWVFDLREKSMLLEDDMVLEGFGEMRSSHSVVSVPGRSEILILGGITRERGLGMTKKGLECCAQIRVDMSS